MQGPYPTGLCREPEAQGGAHAFKEQKYHISSEVHQWALSWLINSMQLKDRGPGARRRLSGDIVLPATAQTISVFAACRDLANAPSDTSVMGALEAGLPKTLRVLEKRLNAGADGSSATAPPASPLDGGNRLALGALLRGAEDAGRNKIYYGKPRQGTTKFHAYATACIVSHGVSYTLAATWVRRHETTVTALNRLLATIRAKELKIRRFLLDRTFFNVTVTRFLVE